MLFLLLKQTIETKDAYRIGNMNANAKMMQSKIGVSATDPSGNIVSILEIGKLYECQTALKTYDPATFELAPPSLIVKCEDGKERKYQAEHFIDVQAARDEKLNQLGI